MAGVRRTLLCVIGSLVVGAAATAAVAWTALALADGGDRHGTGLLIREGTQLWLVTSHSRFGLRWVNLELQDPPLQNRTAEVNDIPAWAQPPQRSWPSNGRVRVATLAVGWPFPVAARQWWTGAFTQTFPLPYEEDESGMSVKTAADRFWEPACDGTGGRTANAPQQILWGGALVDTAIFGLAVLIGCQTVVIFRRRGAT